MVSANSILNYENFIKPHKTALVKEVFEQIGKANPKGITLFEVAEILDKDRHQISGRTSELVSLGLIILSGEFKKIPRARNPRTDHGIWILTPKGVETYNLLYRVKVDKDEQPYSEYINTKNMIQLGQKAKDKITGFSGILVARIEYLTGCDQYGIAPPAKDGKILDTNYFDEGRIEVIGKGVLPKEVKAKKNGGPNRDSPR